MPDASICSETPCAIKLEDGEPNLSAEKLTVQTFRFSEAFGCGEILKPMIESYLAHHSGKLHIFGYEEDLIHLQIDPRIVPVVIDENRKFGITSNELKSKYRKGHAGTAFFWSHIFDFLRSIGITHVVHLDADVIFLGPVVDTLEMKLFQGYGIVGPRRLYRHTRARQKVYERFIHFFWRDAVDTHIIGINLENLPSNVELLETMINGSTSNRVFDRLFPIVDFFDRVTFYILRKRAIYYIDCLTQKRHLTWLKHQAENSLKNKLIVFSAVGSGCVLSKSGSMDKTHPYSDYALKSFYLFDRYFLSGNPAGKPMLLDKTVEDKLQKLNRTRWVLEEDLY